MEQINSFSPNPFIPKDYASMVIDTFDYGNGICKENRPNYFLVLGAAENGITPAITDACGRITFTTVCGNKTFITSDIHRVEQGDHMVKLCSENAQSKKYKLTCKAVTTNCDGSKLAISVKKINCDGTPVLNSVSLDFRCDDPELACSAKITAFIAKANAQQKYYTLTVDPLDANSLILEWNTAGEDFWIEFTEGFTAGSPILLAQAIPAIGKGKDLRRIFKSVECLPNYCDVDKSYILYVFKTRELINGAPHGIFSSTTGTNTNNSQLITLKTAIIAIESTESALISALDTIRTDNLLACNGTTCQPQIAPKYKTYCISRTDAGNAGALTAIKANYPTYVSIVRDHAADGVSYYNATFNLAQTPITPYAGDTISEGACPA